MKELIFRYKPTRKALDMVDDIFTQGDIRYSDPWGRIVTAGFIANGALSLSSRILNEPETLKIPVKGPQKELKRMAAWLLKEKGFDFRFEVSVTGGRPDVIGTRGKERILIECGPCRIDKPIQYLETPNTVLWVLKPESKGTVLYEISRGKRWSSFFSFHTKEQIKGLKEAVDNVRK